MAMQVQVYQTRLTRNDAEAHPLELGQVTFYRTETTTLAEVFADEALETPLDNPITADSAGRIPQVFFGKNYGIRAVVSDQSGVLVDDIDPVPLWSASTSTAETLSFNPTEDNPATNVEDAINNASSRRSIAQGGTGATTAADARENLGLGAASTLQIAEAGETEYDEKLTTGEFVRELITDAVSATIARSAPITAANGNEYTFNHSLGGAPDLISVVAVNTTAEGGYNPNDRLTLSLSATGDVGLGADVSGVQVRLRVGTGGLARVISGSGGFTGVDLDAANWQLIIIAQRLRIDSGDI